MTRILRPLLAAALLLTTASAAWTQDRAQVVAVNSALTDMAERLLGDDGDVVFPVPDDVDPSFWRPAIADISMIQSADLIVLNGAGFATWVDRVSLPRSKLVNTTAALQDQFITTQSITHSHGDGGEHSHEGLATYTWLDPSLATAQAEAIAAALTARGLADEGDIADRLAALTADLNAMDANARSALSDLQDVAIIATHPRYEYFARRYDLSISSLEWDAGAMPTDTEISDLSALMDSTQARILIWESAPPPAALDLTSDLGLINIIFPPLARRVDGRDFMQVFDDAVTELSSAAAQ